MPVKAVRDVELAVTLQDLAWLLPRTIAAGIDSVRALPASELELMRLLVRRPGLSVRDAAAQLRLQPANVSTTLRALEARGLVERRRDPLDGRVVRLHPTDAALAHRREQEKAWGAALRGRLAELAPDEARALRDAAPALRALADALARENR